jgi:hypothetical protein
VDGVSGAVGFGDPVAAAGGRPSKEALP